MDNSVIIVVSILGAVIGFLISLAFTLDDDHNFKKVAIIAAVTIISAIIPFSATVSFYLHQDYSRISNILDTYNNPYSLTRDKILRLEDSGQQIAKSIFTNRLKSIEDKLKMIYDDDEIIIEKDEILNTWTELINSAKDGGKFWATNLVPKNEWQYVSKDSYGISLQRKAMQERGVRIRRINLFDPNDPQHEDGIRNVHLANKEHNIPSKITSLEWIVDNPTYNSTIKSLSTADVVLVDDEILLLTMIDRRTYEMEYAILCFNKDKIEIARDFFERLWNDLESQSIEGNE